MAEAPDCGVIQALIVQVDKARTGANAHTAGKASFYLGCLKDRPKAGFSTCSREQFLALVRAAVFQDQWKELSDAMARWW